MTGKNISAGDGGGVEKKLGASYSRGGLTRTKTSIDVTTYNLSYKGVESYITYMKIKQKYIGSTYKISKL